MPEKKSEREKLFEELRKGLLDFREEVKPIRHRIREHAERLLTERYGQLPSTPVIPTEERSDIIEERQYCVSFERKKEK